MLFVFCPKVKKLIPYLQVSHRKVKRIVHLAVGLEPTPLGKKQVYRSTHPSSTKWGLFLYMSILHNNILLIPQQIIQCLGVFLHLLGVAASAAAEEVVAQVVELHLQGCFVT